MNGLIALSMECYPPICSNRITSPHLYITQLLKKLHKLYSYSINGRFPGIRIVLFLLNTHLTE